MCICFLTSQLRSVSGLVNRMMKISSRRWWRHYNDPRSLIFAVEHILKHFIIAAPCIKTRSSTGAVQRSRLCVMCHEFVRGNQSKEHQMIRSKSRHGCAQLLTRIEWLEQDISYGTMHVCACSAKRSLLTQWTELGWTRSALALFHFSSVQLMRYKRGFPCWVAPSCIKTNQWPWLNPDWN